ncbi:MAG: class I SAM-dependent methyltransferase [Proteobacteria bacterium]|nr:class I SAM-dependent methyltransferase [Pseudomonadota bacterium]
MADFATTTEPLLCAPAAELSHDRPAGGLLGLAERGLLPDSLVRWGVRRECALRLRQELAGGVTAQSLRRQRRLADLRADAVAVHTDAANAQHYELPPAFFAHCLGARLKYSCAYYPRGTETLDQAEEAMLALYGQRAELADGQEILELGAGWGALTLWMAERYPRARICAVSNSVAQRHYVEAQCAARGLQNVSVLTQDVNRLALPAARFDRCVSIEMFEHLRNYDTLFERIAAWLRPQGKLFVHIFAHRTLLYPFETHGQHNWLGRHFFTGGQMPAVDTLLWFQRHMRIEQQWTVDGTHYARTANHWLRNQDASTEQVLAILTQAYGAHAAALWRQRWRMFWMACAETFGYRNGQEWLVAHYRFVRT